MTEHSPHGMKSVLAASGIHLDRSGSRILDDVSATFEGGCVTAIVGPNGAGKSSLIRVLAGVDSPDSGALTWTTRRADAESTTTATAISESTTADWGRMPRRDRSRIVALVEQDAHTELPTSVRAAVTLGRTPHLPLLGSAGPRDAAAVDAALESARVAAFARRELDSLSGGERQRAHLARALAQEPRILLLDEPTNHLDIRAQLDVLKLLRELAASGLTVIAALHDLNHALTFADHLIVLENGRVAASGMPAQTLTPDLIRRVWGVNAMVVTASGRPVIVFDLPVPEERS